MWVMCACRASDGVPCWLQGARLTKDLLSVCATHGYGEGAFAVYMKARYSLWWSTEHMNYVLPTLFTFG